MKIEDHGVIEPSFMDFIIPSEFAKEALYFVTKFGHFYCTRSYCVQRDFLDSFLLIYICHGTLIVETKNQRTEAQENQVVLLDCQYAHKYYCNTDTEFIWFHFDGSSSQSYVNYLYDKTGLIFDGSRSLKHSFSSMLASLQNAVVNEHLVSASITHILSCMATPDAASPPSEHPLYPAISYITRHYSEEMDLSLLAGLCGLSISHFIRSFFKYTGYTPHGFLLLFRLRQAKQLLLTTSKSVEEIGELCGFNSASHFARAFKKQEQISPSEFRKIPY